MLVGLPIWGKVPTHVPQFADELAQGLSHWLLPADARCEALAHPVSAGTLWEVPAPEWFPGLTQPWEQFLHVGPRVLASAPPPEQGAFVWIVRVQVPSRELAQLQRLLAPLRPRDAAMQGLCMRMEAFMEQAGGHARVLPPTALWNADSLARLSWLREVLLQQRSLPEHLFRDSAGYIRLGASAPGAGVRLDLRGESLADIGRILDSARRQRAG